MNDWPICFRVTDTVWAIHPDCAVLHTGPSMPLVIGIDAAILPRADIERRRREGLAMHLDALFERVRRNAIKLHGRDPFPYLPAPTTRRTHVSLRN